MTKSEELILIHFCEANSASMDRIIKGAKDHARKATGKITLKGVLPKVYSDLVTLQKNKFKTDHKSKEAIEDDITRLSNLMVNLDIRVPNV